MPKNPTPKTLNKAYAMYKDRFEKGMVAMKVAIAWGCDVSYVYVWTNYLRRHPEILEKLKRGEVKI